MNTLYKLISMMIIMIVILSVSCAGPPEEMQEEDLIALIKNNLEILNGLKDDNARLKKFMKKFFDNYEALMVFKKNNTIVIDSNDAEPGINDFAYTTGNNRFILSKPLFVTMEKKEVVVSLNNQEWYSSRSDVRKDVEAFKNDYYFDSYLVDNTLEVFYSMSFALGDTAKKVKVDGDKEIITLKKGMVFNSRNEEAITHSIEDVILYIPENSIIHGQLDINGNLIESKTNNGAISIKSSRDFFIYMKNMLPSLSFDKENWDVSIFSFTIEPEFEVYAVDDNEIFFDIKTTANYEKDRKSFSVVKLLVGLM